VSPPLSSGSTPTEAQPQRVVLALNSGSSSLKFGLYRVGPSGVDVLLSGEAESIGEAAGQFHAQDASGKTWLREAAAIPDQGAAVARLADLLTEQNLPPPAVIGHRIVHGGPTLRRHCLIDPAILLSLEAASVFAPLHMPPALAVVRFAQAHFPGVAQAACLDTAFHADLPDVSRVLPIARALQSDGVQRYGFHGLSCESIVRQLAGELPDRLIIAHLGAGASVTAVRVGRSVDTSMGMTPAGGMMMATRSGDLDPGVLLYLMREKHLDAAMLEHLVNGQSGLTGLSGVGGDMRALHQASATSASARLAVRMFCYAAAKQIAAMIAALDGVDLLVFTGGIGENDGPVRAGICDGLSWIGVRLDEARNRSTTNPVNDSRSRCGVRVLPSREGEQIARHAWALAGGLTTSG
jgi:acetate kinase